MNVFAKIYAKLIQEGKRTKEDVPQELREDVDIILEKAKKDEK